MGLFWDLMQQSQISEQRGKADNLDAWVRQLEGELQRVSISLKKREWSMVPSAAQNPESSAQRCLAARRNQEMLIGRAGIRSRDTCDPCRVRLPPPPARGVRTRESSHPFAE